MFIILPHKLTIDSKVQDSIVTIFKIYFLLNQNVNQKSLLLLRRHINKMREMINQMQVFILLQNIPSL